MLARTYGVHDVSVSTIRVGLVDDHLMLLDMAQAILKREQDIQVVGTATTGSAALTLLHERRPDVLVLDMVLPDADGLEILRTLRSAVAEVAILIWTGYGAAWDPRPLLQAGATGYVSKGVSLQAFVAAVRAVAAGHVVVQTDLTATRPYAARESITPREGEVLRLLAEGQRNNEMAATLNVSLRTVERHLMELRAKLQARSLADLVYKADCSGLLSH